MTQFNLANELRRGGTGLLAQAVASLFESPCPSWSAAVWLAEMQARAAAVPAGNQAKAPTALDEMRALQEGARCEPAECDKVQSRLIRELAESREALARVEAEREYWRRAAVTEGEYRDQNNAIAAHWQAECIKRDTVIEAARACFVTGSPSVKISKTAALFAALPALDQAASGPECAQKGHAYATNKGECCIYCFRPKAECLHMGEPASEAEVTERAIVVGSVWEHAYHRMRATVFQLTDHDNSVHFQWEDGERRVWPDWQLRAHFTWVSNPEATESATKETT